eukprot:maker-scaffold95_size379157-snap-gene-2.34 protein:Tk00598 transcript:maker-scaffold95_size379157-snap-gene-2.34-mRNA-1 annotation:"f-box lrr-repeat protein 7"
MTSGPDPAPPARPEAIRHPGPAVEVEWLPSGPFRVSGGSPFGWPRNTLVGIQLGRLRRRTDSAPRQSAQSTVASRQLEPGGPGGGSRAAPVTCACGVDQSGFGQARRASEPAAKVKRGAHSVPDQGLTNLANFPALPSSTTLKRKTPQAAATNMPAPPSMTITPISNSGRSSVANFHMPTSAWSKPAPKKVLRPKHAKVVSCNIHCPGVLDRIPSLSCLACQSMFHPPCLGLIEGLDYESTCDFYCISCKPPPGKENSVPSPAGWRASKAAAAAATPPTLNGGSAEIKPLRQLEAQSIINIAGVKYLAVPHPNKTRVAAARQKRASMIKSGLPDKSLPNELLPLLLKPAKDSPSSMPLFEVEESSDGKLLLLPTDGPLKPGENPFKSAIKPQPKTTSTLVSGRSAETLISTDLSSMYFGLLHVFKYLGTWDRLNASRVCKLWREMTRVQTLWSAVSLKGIHVTNWAKFSGFLNRVHPDRLDLRRMVVQPSDELETWQELAQIAPQLRSVSRVEFHKVPSENLCQIVSNWPGLKSVVAGNVSPCDIDITKFQSEGNSGLAELKLRSVGGKLVLAGGLGSLDRFATNLNVLSLLNTSIGSEDVAPITSLTNLTHLELGDCSPLGDSPSGLFQSISSLKKLKGLRLERSVLGIHLGELRWNTSLENLELIDVQLKAGFGDGLVRLQALKKLLLIPDYQDEVATINAEILDSTLSMSQLTHFYLGLTTEWLNSMKTANQKDSFPILVKGVCEMYSLSKLFKALQTALPNSTAKVLKMKQQSTTKQFIDSFK